MKSIISNSHITTYNKNIFLNYTTLELFNISKHLCVFVPTLMTEFFLMLSGPVHRSVSSVWVQECETKVRWHEDTAICRHVKWLHASISEVSSFMAICSFWWNAQSRKSTASRPNSLSRKHTKQHFLSRTLKLRCHKNPKLDVMDKQSCLTHTLTSWTHSEYSLNLSLALSSMPLCRASTDMDRYILQATVARASASSPCCHRKSAISWRCWSTAHTNRSL